jgi:hypothetical protein
MNTPENAADVLGTPPDLPQGTPAAPSAPVATSPPVAAPPPSELDRDGVAWDARVHETPPRFNERKRWARLRGNAQRRGQGKPPTGVAAGLAWKPPAVDLPASPAAPPPTPPPAVDPPPTASQPPPPELTGAAPPPIRDGVPVPGLDQLDAARPLEAYQATATGMVDGAATVAQLTMGKAWVLKPDERSGLTGAVQRVMHHYQLPVVGPLLELVLVLLPIIGRRRDDPETRQVLGNLLTWWRTRGKPAAPASDPYRSMPAPGSSAPADSIPDAYRDGPAPVNDGVKRVAWIP